MQRNLPYFYCMTLLRLIQNSRFLGVVLLFGVACTHAAPSPPLQQPPPSAPVAPSLQVFTADEKGFDTHSYWLDTGDEVVVFDAQFTPKLAKQLIEHIRTRTASPIRWLVITHPNPDKFNGANAFREAGARVVASRATANAIADVHAYKRHFFVNIARMFGPQDYPSAPTIDDTFDDTFRLPLRSGEVELRVLDNGGVSSTQTVAWLPGSKSLIVGDLVHHQAHAWLEGGIVGDMPRPSIRSWLAALDELEAFRGAVVYGGRGKPVGVRQAVAAQREYLVKVQQIASDYVDSLGSRVSELEGKTAAAHYKVVAERIVAAFPGYSLPYMAHFGVYGLVNHLAALRRNQSSAGQKDGEQE